MGSKHVVTVTQHVVKMTRYERGRTMITNRTLYGYDLQCSCGWATRVNETKREAGRVAKDHAKDGK